MTALELHDLWLLISGYCNYGTTASPEIAFQAKNKWHLYIHPRLANRLLRCVRSRLRNETGSQAGNQRGVGFFVEKLTVDQAAKKYPAF